MFESTGYVVLEYRRRMMKTRKPVAATIMTTNSANRRHRLVHLLLHLETQASADTCTDGRTTVSRQRTKQQQQNVCIIRDKCTLTLIANGTYCVNFDLSVIRYRQACSRLNTGIHFKQQLLVRVQSIAKTQNACHYVGAVACRF